MNIRVCHLALADLWAGAEVQLATLLSYLVNIPELEVSAILLNEGRLAAELRRLGVKITVIEENRNSVIGIFRKLLKHFMENKIDILHTHKYKDNILGSLSGRLAGIQVIVRTTHGMNEPSSMFNSFKVSLNGFLDWTINRLMVDKVIAVSEDICYRLRKEYEAEKIVCIHNGISLERVKSNKTSLIQRMELGIDANGYVIGIVGRLNPVKGIEYFLRSARHIIDQRKDVWFIIVGDGPLKNYLENICRELTLEKHIFFLSHRDDIYDIINSMDIIVLSSLHEGLPMVLLEALALGTPVVATNVGGIPEVIKDGFNGLLIPPRNDRLLAEKCLMLINDSKLIDELAINGKITLEESFSVNYTGNKVFALYKELFNTVRAG